jgi:cyanate permease
VEQRNAEFAHSLNHPVFNPKEKNMSAQRVFVLLIGVVILLGIYVFPHITWFMYLPVIMCIGAFFGICPGLFILKKLGLK